jgi:hypothetical protein
VLWVVAADFNRALSQAPADCGPRAAEAEGRIGAERVLAREVMIMRCAEQLSPLSTATSRSGTMLQG